MTVSLPTNLIFDIFESIKDAFDVDDYYGYQREYRKIRLLNKECAERYYKEKYRHLKDTISMRHQPPKFVNPFLPYYTYIQSMNLSLNREDIVDAWFKFPFHKCTNCTTIRVHCFRFEWQDFSKQCMVMLRNIQRGMPQLQNLTLELDPTMAKAGLALFRNSKIEHLDISEMFDLAAKYMNDMPCLTSFDLPRDFDYTSIKMPLFKINTLMAGCISIIDPQMYRVFPNLNTLELDVESDYFGECKKFKMADVKEPIKVLKLGMHPGGMNDSFEYDYTSYATHKLDYFHLSFNNRLDYKRLFEHMSRQATNWVYCTSIPNQDMYVSTIPPHDFKFERYENPKEYFMLQSDDKSLFIYMPWNIFSIRPTHEDSIMDDDSVEKAKLIFKASNASGALELMDDVPIQCRQL